MRGVLFTFLGLAALATASAQAAPITMPAKATRAEVAMAPSIELVAQGCGYGDRRTRWQELGHHNPTKVRVSWVLGEVLNSGETEGAIAAALDAAEDARLSRVVAFDREGSGGRTRSWR
jgi:hypothetical protein